jgi:ABC-type transport system involved in multi-copper enzyme maturation permease subunit
MKQRPLFLVAILVLILGAFCFAIGTSAGRVVQGIGSVLLLAGALLTMNSNNRTIALNTFREALRNKVLYIILVFAIVMILFAVILGSISIGENDRVIKHVGLWAINVFGIFLAMFVGVNLVYDEMERRTIYTIIAQGVPRQDFIIGKFLGLLLTIVFNFILMALILSLILGAVPEAQFTWMVLYAIFMSIFEMMIVVAFAILFSSFSTPIVSAVLTLAVFVIGRFSDDLLDYIKILGHEAYAFHSGTMVPFLKGLYHVLPHLEEFNLMNQVADASIPAEINLFPVGYGILYSAVVLFLACAIFSRKDFR